MKPNKKQNVRQPVEIMKDLTEARNRFAEAIRSQNYVMIEQFKKRIENVLCLYQLKHGKGKRRQTSNKLGGQNAFSLDK